MVDSSGLGGFGKTLESCQGKSGGRRRINKSPGTWSAGYNKDPPIKEEICPVIDNISDTATKGWRLGRNEKLRVLGKNC